MHRRTLNVEHRRRSAGARILVPHPGAMEQNNRFTDYALAPNALLRVAGLPIRALQDISSPSLSRAIASLLNLQSEIATLRDQLAESLFDEIGEERNSEARRVLVGLRRDVHNNRTRRFRDHAIEQLVSPAIRAKLGHLEELQIGLASARRESAVLYQSEMTRTRGMLRSWLSNEGLLNAIALSSPALFQGLDKYQRAAPSAIRSREEHVERGVLRYFERAAAKTTPFSTFCLLVPAKVCASSADRGHAPTIVGSVDRARTQVRPNKLLLARIMQRICSDAKLSTALSLIVNPTIRQSGDQLRLLFTGPSGVERFGRLGRAWSLEMVIMQFERSKPITAKELIGRLVADATLGATRDEASAFVAELLRIGVLTVVPLVNDQETEWIAIVCEFLRTAELRDEPTSIEIERLLMQFAIALQRLSTADARSRHSLMLECRKLVAAIASGRMPRHLEGMPVLEDATCDAIGAVPRSEALTVLARLLSIAAPAAYPREERARIWQFYMKKFYGRPRVPVLEFLEEYSQELAHSRERRQPGEEAVRTSDSQQQHDGPVVARLAANVRQAMQQIVSQARESGPIGGDVEIGFTELNQALPASFPNDISDAAWSVSAFVQFARLPDDSRPVIVLPNGISFTGFGKYFSRFLYLLPTAFVDGVRAHNRALGAQVAELAHDACFNANLHPDILPRRIEYPLAGYRSAVGRISIDDLAVVPSDESLKSVHLVDLQTLNRIVPVDLGFQNPRMRPALFQFLSLFCPVAAFAFAADESAVAHFKSSMQSRPAASHSAVVGVRYRPRIVFERHLVIARRSWLIADLEMKEWLAKSSDPAESFFHINQQRLEYGIPERVFARVVMNTAPNPSTLEEQRRVATVTAQAGGRIDTEVDDFEEPTETSQSAGTSRNRHKPLFVDFASPLSLSVFTRTIPSLSGHTVILEECLPDVGDAIECSGDRWMAEAVVEICSLAECGDECGEACAN